MKIYTKHYVIDTAGPWWRILGAGATLKRRGWLGRVTIFRKYHPIDLYTDIKTFNKQLPYPDETKYILEKLTEQGFNKYVFGKLIN